MQRGCTAAQRAAMRRVELEPPVSLGEKLENVCFGRFSKTRRTKSECEIPASSEWQISLQARRGVASSPIAAFQKLTRESERDEQFEGSRKKSWEKAFLRRGVESSY